MSDRLPAQVARWAHERFARVGKPPHKPCTASPVRARMATGESAAADTAHGKTWPASPAVIAGGGLGI